MPILNFSSNLQFTVNNLVIFDYFGSVNINVRSFLGWIHCLLLAHYTMWLFHSYKDLSPLGILPKQLVRHSSSRGYMKQERDTLKLN